MDRYGGHCSYISHSDINRSHLVKELIVKGAWNTEQFHLPEYLAELILSFSIGDSNKPDNPIWMTTSNGKFSTALPWGIIRPSQDPDPILHNIWHKFTPFKMSFQAWEMLKNKLPFDNIISRFGIDVDTKCCCCLVAEDETIHHFS